MLKDDAKLEKNIATAIAILLTIAFLVMTFIVVPSFQRLLAEAEFHLPPVTKLAIDSSPYWNIFGAVAVIGSFLVSRSRKGLGWFLIVTAGLTFLATIPFLVHAMYEPIFQLELN